MGPGPLPSNIRRTPEGLDKVKGCAIIELSRQRFVCLAATTYTIGATFIKNSSECCVICLGTQAHLILDDTQAAAAITAEAT